MEEDLAIGLLNLDVEAEAVSGGLAGLQGGDGLAGDSSLAIAKLGTLALRLEGRAASKGRAMEGFRVNDPER